MVKWIKENSEFIPIIVMMAVIVLIVSGNLLYEKEKIQKVEKVEVSMKIENSTILEMNASGYAIGSPYSSITKSGHPVISLGYVKIGDENIFTVATDKNIIPLGSLIYIDSLGIGMVQDTGSEIKGNEIDICLSSLNEAKNFGRKKVKVLIIRLGKEK